MFTDDPWTFTEIEEEMKLDLEEPSIASSCARCMYLIQSSLQCSEVGSIIFIFKMRIVRLRETVSILLQTLNFRLEVKIKKMNVCCQETFMFP